jgi:hypothetical protein
MCGNTTFAGTSPYYTHQVIELPPIAMEVTHWVLHEGWCQACGRWRQAHVPAEQASGYGPRFSALLGELAGTYGNGRRMVQTFCASVLQVPISLGAIQKVLDRVTQAIDPYYAVMAQQARQASVNYIDETPWYCLHTLEWLWVMASERVAFYMIHPRRSKEAFAALIDAWEGILVSDGYGVYQHWVEARQTCVAHLIRSARGLAARAHPDLAACGTWALAELQRLCHMAKAPPPGDGLALGLSRPPRRRAHQQPGRESLAMWRPVAEAVLGDGEHQGQPLGGADPVPQRNLPSPRQSDLRRAGGRPHEFLPWPTPRSLLDQRGGEHLCASPVSALI